jgi:hypothetical protein
VLGQATSDLDSFDSPRPGLGGSHHLPLYSILCSSAQRLHPNESFSRDSQDGVPKLSWFGLLGLWAFITFCPELGSGRGCSSPQELSNDMSHSCCRRRGRVNSRLLVVGSQTSSLTPDPSFAHNLGCRCPNGSYEAILDIYTSRPFQWYKEHPNTRCFDPWTRALNFRKSHETPTSHFRECGLHLHTYPKVGLRHLPNCHHLLQLKKKKYKKKKEHEEPSSSSLSSTTQEFFFVLLVFLGLQEMMTNLSIHPHLLVFFSSLAENDNELGS